jgi:hypothetical protein
MGGEPGCVNRRDGASGIFFFRPPTGTGMDAGRLRTDCVTKVSRSPWSPTFPEWETTSPWTLLYLPLTKK